MKEFAAQQHLDGILKGTPNSALRAFLLRKPGDLTSAELSALREQLALEGKRRRALFEEAKRHYGVDGGVFARDPRTLVVELNAPTPYFLELTAFYPAFPVPRWAIETSSGRNWFLPGHIVSNGPFNLTEWRVGDHIRLERSETYWGRADVKLHTVDVLPIENTTTGLNLYLTGEADWMPQNSYPQDLAPDLRKRADFYIGPALIVYYYRINCTRKPFDDARVRQALNLAVDREQITRDVLGVGQLPADHLVPPGIRGYTPPETGIRYDVARARQLLAEAGFPDGKGFPKFGILYNTLEAHKKIAEVIADQLRKNLNIEVTAYNQEWQSFLQSTRSLDYDLLSRSAWWWGLRRPEHVPRPLDHERRKQPDRLGESRLRSFARGGRERRPVREGTGLHPRARASRSRAETPSLTTSAAPRTQPFVFARWPSCGFCCSVKPRACSSATSFRSCPSISTRLVG